MAVEEHKTQRPAVSLANFNENDPKCVITSPRSLRACKSEGVLPQELSFKPIEAFQERSLSPRLIKLRFDFFEAKRRDLLAAARRARDAIMAEERREKEVSQKQIDTLAKESGFSKGAIMALNSDTLKLEREKLRKAQEHERQWLKNALRHELEGLKKLETNNIKLTEEESNEQERMNEASNRLKEINDKMRQEQEQKALEFEARQKLEKQIAKEEFLKQQQELKQKQEAEAIRQAAAFERQMKEMERKKEAERKKEEAREAAYREQEAMKEEMRAKDLKKQDMMEQQRLDFKKSFMSKKESRDLRIIQSVANNQDLERKRREEFERRQAAEQEREERLMQGRALDQESSAKKSFQQMMRRKMIMDESRRKAEERRIAILEEQEETEKRLMDHEQKKERYLDFKRELDGLRSQNKEINVQRQRRKEEAQREEVADHVRKKDEKMEWMQSERRRLWQIRRAAQSEAHRCRELVKSEIMRQRVASKYNSSELQKQMEVLMKHELFSHKVLGSSASAPNMKTTASTSASA